MFTLDSVEQPRSTPSKSRGRAESSKILSRRQWTAYLPSLKGRTSVSSRSSFTRACILLVFHAIASLQLRGQTTVHKNLSFRPRQEIPAGQFMGNQSCVSCHQATSRSQSDTDMAHALGLPGENRVLRSHPHMRFRAGQYTYEIITDANQSTFLVTDGKQIITEPIAYVFGNAHLAQTYVLQHNGRLYEGRVSYYTAVDGLDWTIGDALNPPPSLEAAFGRDITGDEAKNCFSCHGTGAITDNQLRLDHLTPGVTCEACHGPGDTHVVVAQSRTGEAGAIFNAKSLSPNTLSQEFCGACHRSADAVGMMPDLGGAMNVRFQPYRLARSRGHDSNDPRLACTACHDPHIDLSQQAADSDSKCTVCHSTAGSGSTSVVDNRHGSGANTRVAKSCPISREKCTSCHMPKIEILGTHLKFTDHRIRIVRPGAPYPI